ncbi:SCO2102 family sporulation regulator [Streptomyces acidiscabies]|uniref:SCO2102 family sporulation regulator n=1 Tax=Streptomyces acidiscabies TaxID=42234 RepID=UPI0009516AC5|nr:hypothetical protein [Streptomyces acidiscabies]
MGWTVLYIAFGVVALWLLGEVLLQYKARLRWRLLAFAGFLGVVFGVLIPSVPVIAVGAVAFAIGQTYVTLSFRKGFESGWAVSRPGLAESFTKRRKGKKADDAPAGPPTPPPGTAEAPDAPYETAAPSLDAAATAAFERATGDYDDDFDRDDVFTPARPLQPSADTVYEPQPLPDETGTYGVYSDAAYAAATGQDQYAAYYNQQQGYGYDTTGEQQQYAAYSDPYIGTQTYGTGTYDTTGYDQQQYGTQQGYPQDQYAQQGYPTETPAGGVWVPQQRNTDDPSYGDLPADQQYYQDGQGQQQQQQQHGNGYDEQQYRF